MKYMLLLLSFLLLPDMEFVHQDTPLGLDEKGNIKGLPKEFGPAVFNLDSYYLRIKDKEMLLPGCISNYFDIHEEPKVNLYASWYHSKEFMPYYLHIKISQENEKYGYSILVDLETLELIYVQISITEGKSTYFHQIKQFEDCLENYNESIQYVD